MSDTPRTDQVRITGDPNLPEEVVAWGFAGRLERELIEAKTELESLRKTAWEQAHLLTDLSAEYHQWRELASELADKLASTGKGGNGRGGLVAKFDDMTQKYAKMTTSNKCCQSDTPFTDNLSQVWVGNKLMVHIDSVRNMERRYYERLDAERRLLSGALFLLQKLGHAPSSTELINAANNAENE